VKNGEFFPWGRIQAIAKRELGGGQQGRQGEDNALAKRSSEASTFWGKKKSGSGRRIAGRRKKSRVKALTRRKKEGVIKAPGPRRRGNRSVLKSGKKNQGTRGTGEGGKEKFSSPRARKRGAGKPRGKNKEKQKNNQTHPQKGGKKPSSSGYDAHGEKKRHRDTGSRSLFSFPRGRHRRRQGQNHPR